MNSLKNKVVENYKKENFENAKIVSFDDYENSELKYYKQSELTEVDEDWFPLCCFKDEETGELTYGGRAKIVHTYVEGETGCGKTTRVAIQSVNALSNMKNKPSFVIVDPYGEIYENNYKNLTKKGYSLKVLNCDRPERSDTYNPLGMTAKNCVEDGEINSESQAQIRKIAEIVQPVIGTKDPIWDQGARAYYNGILLDSFEDLIDGYLEPEHITLYNTIQRHYWIRKALAASYDRSLFSIPEYKRKTVESLGIQKMISVTNNAERTRDSYFGVAENHFDNFGQIAMYQLSSSSTIDLEEFINEPTAIFIQSGSTSIGDDLVSLLMNDIYNTAVRIGKKSLNKKLPRNIHCFLDEFANCNFGSGEEFIKMLTTSRKFGLFWHMYLQCDAQLDKKYNSAEIGNIIRANSTEIFMGSQDYRTIDRFAGSCGKKTTESLNSKLYQSEMSLVTVNLITTDKLMYIPEGYMYIKVNRKPLLYSYFEAFYKCDAFERCDDIEKIYPYNTFNYKTTLRTPDMYDEEAAQKNPNRPKTPAVKWQFIQDKLKWIQTPSGNKILAVDITKEESQDSMFPRDFFVCKESEMKEYHPVKNVKTADDAFDEFTKIIFEANLNKYIESLNAFSCIPDQITDFLKNPDDEDGLNTKMMKFEIIEKYISANDYTTKEQWMKDIKSQVSKIKKNKMLPESILKVFDGAVKELESLTIENINEIKRLID